TQSKIIFQQNLLFDLFQFSMIKSLLFQLKRIGEEQHQTVDKDFLAQINKCREFDEQHIQSVAEKFKKQIYVALQDEVLPEENEALQERVKKGCAYFMQQLTALEDLLKQTDFDTDNKAVRKQLDEVLDNMDRELFIKRSGLKLCNEGFQTL